MTEVPSEVDAGTGAALELVRVFAEHGHSVEAVKAAASADLLTIAVALFPHVPGHLDGAVPWLRLLRPGRARPGERARWVRGRGP